MDGRINSRRQERKTSQPISTVLWRRSGMIIVYVCCSLNVVGDSHHLLQINGVCDHLLEDFSDRIHVPATSINPIFSAIRYWIGTAKVAKSKKALEPHEGRQFSRNGNANSSLARNSGAGPDQLIQVASIRSQHFPFRQSSRQDTQPSNQLSDAAGRGKGASTTFTSKGAHAP